MPFLQSLDIFDFVNVSNPATKAVSVLLQKAAATVSTAAAAAVGEPAVRAAYCMLQVARLLQ